MARNIQSLLRITSNVFNQNITKNIFLSGTRTLYTATALGLDNYRAARENIGQQFSNMSDKFREKMRAYVTEESQNMIFTEDLKNMLHLVRDDKADLELLEKMMTKFNSQNKELRFGSFVFGPVIMRTYYYLDKPDEALAAFNNPTLEGFFDQVVSYQILMDLLYNHNKFAELRHVFESIIVRNTDFTKYPRHAVILIMAACYKENTPDSFKYAVDLWQDLKNRGHHPMHKSSTFFAGLALNQGRPDIAIEVLFNLKQFNYFTIRNLKVVGLAELDRLDDIVPILRMSLTSDNPSQIKHTYVAEVMDKLDQAIQRAQLSGNETIVHLVRQLKQNGHVTNTTLDNLISVEIDAPRSIDEQRNSNRNNDFNYNSQTGRPRGQSNDNNNYLYRRRPGLKELM